MRKILSLVLLTFLVFSLAACGTEGEQPDMASTAEDTVSSEITEPEESTALEPLESEEPSASEEESKQQTKSWRTQRNLRLWRKNLSSRRKPWRTQRNRHSRSKQCPVDRVALRRIQK